MWKETLLSIFIVGFIGISATASEINIPSDGWTVNNFKKEGCGADLSFEKAPDGSNAIRIKFFGNNSCNVVMPRAFIAQKNSKWPENFSGLKGYFWNNGKMNIANISMRSINKENGKYEQFVARIILEHDGWKQITINEVVNYQNKKAVLKPCEIESIFISSGNNGNAEFAIGALHWEKEGIVLHRENIGRTQSLNRASFPPVIDGNINDDAWKDIDKLQLDNLAFGKPERPSNKSWMKTSFDDKYFYIAGYFPFKEGTKLKASMKETDSALWEEEDMEIFVYPDADARTYYQFMLNPIGTRGDMANVFDQIEDRITCKFKNWNGAWDAVTKINKDNWTAEIRIPWETIGATGKPEVLQFQTMRCDNTCTPPEYPVWSPVIRKSVDGFGFLTLNDKKGNGPRISNLEFKRNKDNKIFLNFNAESEKELGKFKVKVRFAAPSSPSETFEKDFEIPGKAGTVFFELPSNKIFNGKYQALVTLIPENKEMPSSSEAYYFNQTLPSKVGFSDIVFNPVPKKLELKDGSFALRNDDVISVLENASGRTVKTAEYLASKLYGLYGIKPAVVKNGKGRITLSTDKKSVKDKTHSDSGEAYLLNVSPEKINICGAGEAGLYYAVVTLMQAAKATKQPNQPLKALSISDWPSYEKRISGLYTMFHLKKDCGDGKGGIDINKFKDWIERNIAGSKYNTLFIAWADQVNYPSVPEIRNPRNFSPEEIKDIFNFAREHFIDACPGILFGAHSPSITRYFPDIIEKKFGVSQMDVTNPKVYELMNKFYTDLIEMSGGRPGYFLTFNDEWWHKNKTQDDVLYKGKTRQEIFYDFLMAEYNILKKRNIKMVMCTDMLHPRHNGGAPFDLYKVTDKLPRDIVLASWSENNSFFAEKGFGELWYIGNGFTADYRKPYIKNSGFGQINYHTNTLFNQTDQARALNYGYHTELQTANYAWNRDEKGSLPMPEWTMQYMPSLLGIYSMEANPKAGNKVSSIEIPTDKSIMVNTGIKDNAMIGGIPVKSGVVIAKPGQNIIIGLPEKTKLSSLYILDAVKAVDTASVKKLQDAFRQTPSSSPYGLIVGKYILNYADGSKSETEIRLGRNIALYEFTPVESRFVNKCRYVYPVKKDYSVGLSQYELVNPAPEKEVKSFEIKGNFDFAPILLCGLSIRNVK